MSDAEVLGSELREARLSRDLTLDQVERQIRIRAKYLEALEQANYTALPSEVQARGFLRNYARFLGMDGDVMVSRYDAALLQQQNPVKRPARREDPTITSVARRTQPVVVTPSPYPTPQTPPASDARSERRRSRSWLSTLALGVIGLAVLTMILIVGAQLLQAYLAQNDANNLILTPLATSTATADVSPTPDMTMTPLRPTSLPNPNGSPTVAAASSGSGPVALQLQITERTWLRVTVDGQISYMGSAPPDTILQYQGTNIQVRVANAIGVHAVVNGQDLGILGARGQIVDQTFTANGPLAASPTPPPKSALNAPKDATSQGATFLFTSTALLVGTATRTKIPSATPRGLPSRAPATATRYPTLPNTATITATTTNTVTPSSTFTPSSTLTPTSTLTPSVTFTPSVTRTPTNTPTNTATFTPSSTLLFLPNVTDTPQGGEIRPKGD